MPRRICAGNWKMNGLSADLDAVRQIAADVGSGAEVVICPPATLLAAAVQAASGALAIGGQDCHPAAAGAHTGDLSAAMLADAGASHVILGHSERRTNHGETDALIAAKVSAAQAAGLTAILCVGEALETRNAGRAEAVVAAQLAASLPRGVDPARLIVAYEPIWAIGTSLVPDTFDIKLMHAELRATLAQVLGAEGADVPLLYGGSVSPQTAQAIFATPGVDGALVGGASLTAATFLPVLCALQGA